LQHYTTLFACADKRLSRDQSKEHGEGRGIFYDINRRVQQLEEKGTSVTEVRLELKSIDYLPHPPETSRPGLLSDLMPVAEC